MKFIKMQGAGNDYIFVDCLDKSIDNLSELTKEMSDRHYGIGGDGVVYLYPSFVADVRMRMFNADGSEGDMCGNAVRCIARLLYEKSGKSEFTVETNAGIRNVERTDDGLFTVDMGKPVAEKRSLFAQGKQLDYIFVDIGNPHCVIFDRADMALAEAIEHHSFYPNGINVEFVEPKGDNSLLVRVWERGSGETLSCGTGACASAVAAVYESKADRARPITVSLRGGTLTVNFINEKIFLIGDAVKIYEGVYHDKIHFCDRRRSQRLG